MRRGEEEDVSVQEEETRLAPRFLLSAAAIACDAGQSEAR